ncbi:MAG TPA: glycosyl hydrolase family 18 protein [Candidatus Limnocylindrales bacterium]
MTTLSSAPPSAVALERGGVTSTAAPGADPAFDRASDPGPPDPVTTDVPGAAAGIQPSVQYEQALAHAGDRTVFAPGERVTTGYTPQADDAWTVDGQAPAALPAGRLDGKAIRAQRDGEPGTPTRGIPDRMVDLPNDPTPAIQARAASFTPPSTEGSLTTQAAVTRLGLRREIFGFLPYWELNANSLRIDYRRISTIAYFGIGADAAGNLQKRNPDGTPTVGWSGWTSAKLSRILAAAHRNHTRVVLTVQSFAWNATGRARQQRLLASPSARANLARQIAAAVRDRGADGVNLDFEPLVGGSAGQFTALVRSIRAQLNRVHRGYQLTFDTTGRIGNYPIEAATARGGADAIFVMGYDYRASSSSPVGSIAPIDGSGYDIRKTIAAYLARVPASKLILGVPYYGRAWSTPSAALHASNTSSTRTGSSTTVTYDTAASYLARYGRRYDAREGVAWTAYRRQSCTTRGCVTSWRQIYVDDATAIRRKYDLVNAYGLRGAGIWALGYDGTRPELWNAIQAKFITDSTPPTVGVKTLPVRVVNPAFLVSWLGTDDVGVASFDVQVSVDGAAWRTWISRTRARSAVWYGLDGHGYAFRVRARDPKGNTSRWNVASTSRTPTAAVRAGGFAVARVSGLAVRSAPSPAATRLGSLSAGNLVAVVAGPRVAHGITWVQIVGPTAEWTSIRPAFRGAWVALRAGSRTYLTPTKPANATTVSAYLGGLGFDGAGRASLGSSATALRHRLLSPNGDGARDLLRIDWTNAVKLDRLVLRVYRADGRLVGDVPVAQLAAGARSWSWNGRVAGHRLPDGRYLTTLVGRRGAATFFNPSLDFRANAYVTTFVTVDTRPPVVTAASISGTLLSPNGDGARETVTASVVARDAARWAFGVAPVQGRRLGAPIVVKSGGGSRASVTWNGRSASGAAAPDGLYKLQLLVADVAGNRTSRTWTVRLDRTGPAVSLAGPASFSPNRDGASDGARLSWSAGEPITGTAEIRHGSTLVRSWPIPASRAGAVSWNGTNRAGARVADGRYAFRVVAKDASGNATIRSIPVTVDRTLASLRWAPGAFFSQDGDATAARSTLSFRQARPATVSAAIYWRSTLIRTIWANRRLPAGSHGWTWDGRSNAGLLVARGSYTVRIAATSALGTSVLTRSVLVDAFSVALPPGPIRAGRTLTITLTTVESLKGAPTVAFTQHGKGAVRKTATSLGGGRYRVSFVVAKGAPGTAWIVVSGRDVRGGLNTTSRQVAVR